MVNKLPYHMENPIDNIIYSIVDTQLPYFYKYNISPNMLTTISLLFWVFGAYYFYLDKYIISAILYFFSYYFDCADGKMARKYDMVTKFGDYYDHINDLTKIIVFCILCYYKSKQKTIKLIPILIIIIIFTTIFFNCQEKIYDVNDSQTLNIFKINILTKQTCVKNYGIIRFIGVGTTILIHLLIIIFWKYI